MKRHLLNNYWIGILLLLAACDKDSFLDKKSSTAIVSPTRLTDFQQLLDNTIFNYTAALPQLAADEYEVSYASWQASASVTQRNSYIWAKDIYGGEKNVRDWNVAFTQIFYTNAVLEGLASSESAGTPTGQFIKGQALFKRAYACYDLVRNFCKAYDEATAATDAGIPIRLNAGVDEIAQRASLKRSMDQILTDLRSAVPLLPAARPSTDLFRPSKPAVYALIARVYLDMRHYTEAEAYADSCLALYSRLIDYNSVSTSSATPFSTTNDELIYNTCGFANATQAYTFIQASTSSAAKVPVALTGLYAASDLRLKVFYARAADGSYTRKRGYYGSGNYPFTGLATDEVYLVKAECLARRGETAASLLVLNALLQKRFVNTAAYVPVTAATPQETLDKVLLERRKELSWRCLRWPDLKRLNKEGAGIVLSRQLNGETYTLEPNSPRYVLPIPDDEIALSGITQNER
ncbi:RagB/SusD family nutrient uptake outer membrane protein [Arcticibacter tournemirensis]|uniref:RagB/SusD family nutrient uptake outer membrane protein n=1 Tax=Arcticibacter tournemirensis TaxID=699437 RepID=A0A4V1KIV0_9SPHI|nr:RagB/SusD family nutrient uptake outer membrane protein [Arcticibacter tournemirensis]RXF71962.1 RagB/SusD family nutrient uptake outer membrane protein [Arcticibacter tournemirensis]